MTFKVFLSQLSSREEFEHAVQTHMRNLVEFNKKVNVPRPTAHPLIENSIKRVQTSGHPDSYVADYEIVDDRPPEAPKPSLEDRKNILVAKLRETEIQARNKAFPNRRLRLLNSHVNTAMRIKEEDRTEEHKNTLLFHEQVVKEYNRIDFIGATAESDIEDLTEETIDSWQLPTF